MIKKTVSPSVSEPSPATCNTAAANSATPPQTLPHRRRKHYCTAANSATLPQTLPHRRKHYRTAAAHRSDTVSTPIPPNKNTSSAASNLKSPAIDANSATPPQTLPHRRKHYRTAAALRSDTVSTPIPPNKNTSSAASNLKSPAIDASDTVFRMLYIIAVIMIVDGHVGSEDYLDFNGLLRYQNYHIALFMFTSGYFLNLARSYKEFFTRKALRLLLPLYLWNAAYGVLCWYLNHHHGFSLGGEFNLYNLFYAPLVDGHQFIYNMASWFLVPLFLVQTIGFLTLRPFTPSAAADNSETYPQSDRLRLPAVIFFIISLALGCFALAYAPENNGARTLTLTAMRTLYFLPAFAFGFLYRHYLAKYDTVSTPFYLFTILAVLTFLTRKYPGYNHIPSWLDSVNAPELVLYAISFLAILFWLRIARVLSPLLVRSRPLQYISTHTFDIMMHHFVGFMFAKALFLLFIPAAAVPAAIARIKSDIWYYPFPANGETSAWLYISISIVIALMAGFTIRNIYAIIRGKLNIF